MPARTPIPPRRRRTALAACALTLAGASITVALAPAARAAVPAFPDNIVVFPNRDMVSLEGFAAASGKPVTIEVRRGSTVIGSTTGTGASPAAIAAGEPTVEVNHPGGVCWGAGGGLQVTPDIRAGDVITVRFDGQTYDTTVQAAEVTGATRDGNRLEVTGTVGAGVNTAQLEQRIINPEMRDDPAIGRRDVRAVPPAGLVQAPKGDYRSGLAVSGGSFTATYEFPTPGTAEAAEAGQLRVMAWQDEDADGNRQGLTISEFGEIDGPGMGGCPAGAAGQGPRSPSSVTAAQQGDRIRVTWTPAQQNPGTAPVQGWSVRAVSTASTGGVQTEFGVRLSNPAATTVDLPGTLAGNRVEVRAITANGESWPPALNGTSTGTPGGGDGDTTAPTVRLSPAGGTFTQDVSVSFTPEAGSDVFYTLDGSSPLDAPDAASAGALKYEGTPVPLGLSSATPTVTLRYVAIDAAGNTSMVTTETYTFGTSAAPGAPTVGTVTAGDRQAVVSWTAPAAPGSSPVTGYRITATPAAGSPAAAVPVSVDAGANATRATVTGLVNGVTYAVTATATSTAGTSQPSAPVQVVPTAPASDTVAVTRASWKAGDLRIEGTGTQPGATISIRANGPTGPVIGTATVAQPAAGAVTGVWTLRVRTGQYATTRPTNVFAVSSGGGQVGPITLANG
ncbi:fibronectin type III domain-containing protein [Geodermatophilus sp. FMUSA9-8]|uniref:fibronectin type III domain-containing protein n=1 Tax=Geodermatophilus sp. FMUSA9-8 TaxID=3120155 RepID=UPI00300B5131